MRALVGWRPVSTMTWLDRELGEIANRIRVADDRAGTVSFLPPAEVTLDGDDAEAGYDRGMLTIRVRTVVRPEPTPTPTRIAVTAGRASTGAL